MEVKNMPPLPEDKSSPAGQKQFSQALRHADHATPDGVVGPDGAVSHKRFSVYRNNVAISLIEAMAANFPAIERLVGEAFFASLAKAYIFEHPPSIPMLFLYGDQFAEFLETFEPVKELPYLADVARVEFAWLQAYHAADEDIVDAPSLAAIPAENVGQAIFSAHPASWVFRSIWPAATIVSRNREGADCSDIDLSQGEDILITRPELDVQTRVLPQGGYGFLSSLIAGATLEQATVTATQNDENFDLSMQLSGILECGVFTTIGV
jgi:hypothetical protein